jgi:hypothetical protein
VAAAARSERREVARVLGLRRKVKRRWVVETSARCLLRPNQERWYGDDDDDEVDYRSYYADLEGCRSAPVVIGQRIIPACSHHLAEWAHLVGLDWAARVGVIPFACDASKRSAALLYPRNPLPSRAPRPGSTGERGSLVYVSGEEFEMLTDALHEIGAPIARLFSLEILRCRTDDYEEQVRVRSEWHRERNLIWATRPGRQYQKHSTVPSGIDTPYSQYISSLPGGHSSVVSMTSKQSPSPLTDSQHTSTSTVSSGDGQ